MVDLIQVKQNAKQALARILGDQDAAVWCLEGREVESLRRRFSERNIALVSFDVDRIKDLVLASVRPLEIQGASEIVKDLSRDRSLPWRQSPELPSCSVYRILQEEGLGAEHVLFAGGGTGLLIVPSEKAPRIADAIRSRFTEASEVGSCTVVWRAFYPHELVAGPDLPPLHPALPPGIRLCRIDSDGACPFGRIVQLLADDLRQAKEERLDPPIAPLPGILRRCDVCGVRAAEESWRFEDQTDWLCAPCYHHRQRGRLEREWLEKQKPELKTAESISDIAGLEAERGYVAVIYADANGMGQMLFAMGRMADYALFSQTVTEVFDMVITDIVQRFNLKGRYQAPILGGDDLLFLVPAGKAADLVAFLMREVKNQFSARADTLQPAQETVAKLLRQITLSVGFAIVPAHFNIRFSVDYAETLLRRAKEARYDSETEMEWVDWMVLKDGSPLSLHIKELRDTVYRRRQEGQWSLDLTSKPVPISRFLAIVEWIEQLQRHEVPRHQLKALQDLLQTQSPQAARLNIRYQWLKVDEWRTGFFGDDPKRGDSWLREFVLVEKPGHRFETGFLDLLELYEFREAS